MTADFELEFETKLFDERSAQLRRPNPSSLRGPLRGDPCCLRPAATGRRSDGGRANRGGRSWIRAARRSCILHTAESSWNHYYSLDSKRTMSEQPGSHSGFFSEKQVGQQRVVRNLYDEAAAREAEASSPQRRPQSQWTAAATAGGYGTLGFRVR